MFSNSSFSPGIDYSVSGSIIVGFFEIGIDLGSPSYRWRNVYAGNGTINTSDKRYKQNVQPLHYGLADVLSLSPVSFEWKNMPSKTKLGLIAQDILEIIPEVVDVGNNDDKTLGVYYSDLIPVLIKAIQEQQQIIENQEDKIDELNKNNVTQKAELSKLEGSNTDLEKRLSAIENYLKAEAKNK